MAQEHEPWVTEAVEIIKNYFVNRNDVYGHYYTVASGPDGGKIRSYTAPRPSVIASAKEKGKAAPYLGPRQIASHLLHIGKPVGCHAISRADACKWLALDIDRHGPDISGQAVEAARDAIVGAVRQQLGLECVVEDSGGGWHVWLLLAEPVPAREAWMMAKHLKAIGAEAWLRWHEKVHIDVFPSSSSHTSSREHQGGKWLRLPGKHHRRDHDSSLLMPDGGRVKGATMWPVFKECAQRNTQDLWHAALVQVRALSPESAKRSKPVRTTVKTKTEPAIHSYHGWSTERLTTEPLGQGERRERERALVRAVLSGGGSQLDAEAAVARLYAEGAGESIDLASPTEGERLRKDIPNLVARLSCWSAYRWASPDHVERVRQRLLDRVADLQQRGVAGWSVLRFTRWFDRFYEFVLGRAADGGNFYLAETIAKAIGTKTRGGGMYGLRDGGGATAGVHLDPEFMDYAGKFFGKDAPKLSLRPRKVSAYLAHLYLLLTTPATDDGQPIVRLVTPARRGYIPWTLDCRAMPLVPHTVSASLPMILSAE
jgi:hypothetical protein